MNNLENSMQICSLKYVFYMLYKRKIKKKMKLHILLILNSVNNNNMTKLKKKCNFFYFDTFINNNVNTIY